MLLADLVEANHVGGGVYRKIGPTGSLAAHVSVAPCPMPAPSEVFSGLLLLGQGRCPPRAATHSAARRAHCETYLYLNHRARGDVPETLAWAVYRDGDGPWQPLTSHPVGNEFALKQGSPGVTVAYVLRGRHDFSLSDESCLDSFAARLIRARPPLFAQRGVVDADAGEDRRFTAGLNENYAGPPAELVCAARSATTPRPTRAPAMA